ncbi:hypothetical protein GCM10008904_21560 [Paraclostridium ghonii]|uniref:Chitodextrinase n=1 Tax=Paraclostridium ghonii TaxID=29358 RepID=A0ABU0N110_9FIRM|nr:immunoglobulin-like domain-containing protein [Paeniclostridium ghonii]MDQ0556549.1 chitodextrinase [Paeniclostridium ghonii]
MLNGVSNKDIFIGQSFDVLEGVIANDKEDSDLTSKIKVSGNVDTSKVGEYKLTYKVINSKNVEATAIRTITVKEKIEETYNPEKVYLAGDRVVYNGKEYVAKLWTKGEIPGSSSAWELA